MVWVFFGGIFAEIETIPEFGVWFSQNLTVSAETSHITKINLTKI